MECGGLYKPLKLGRAEESCSSPDIRSSPAFLKSGQGPPCAKQSSHYYKLYLQYFLSLPVADMPSTFHTHACYTCYHTSFHSGFGPLVADHVEPLVQTSGIYRGMKKPTSGRPVRVPSAAQPLAATIRGTELLRLSLPGVTSTGWCLVPLREWM